MPILRIEHPVADLAAWRDAFDRDPLGREESGVRSYVVWRSLEDAAVFVDLDFAMAEEAEAMRGRLQRMWSGVQKTGLIGDQRTALLEQIDMHTYGGTP